MSNYLCDDVTRAFRKKKNTFVSLGERKKIFHSNPSYFKWKEQISSKNYEVRRTSSSKNTNSKEMRYNILLKNLKFEKCSVKSN